MPVKKEDWMTPVSVRDYIVKDRFWTPKMEMVRERMIPYQWEALNDRIKDAEPSFCIQNFRIAAGLEEGEFKGYVFQDSDVAKWLEAVGYTLAWRKDEELEKTADEVIELIRKVQRPDGYLDTYYIINGLEKRWTNLRDHHELYCAGHMIEAGIAYYLGTGKTALLDVGRRLADCVDRVFGPEEGKLHGYPGHEIIEMALVRLYDVTKEERYLKLAEYFINERGKEPLYFREEQEKNHQEFYWKDSLFQYQYYQAGKPVRGQEHAEGHAVRAVYLYSGMTDVARQTGDESLMRAVRTLWKDVTKRQMYITGAIGSSDYGEAFTFPYDLPNDEVYGETCASIGLVFWARRMLQNELNGEYADVMERALYNGCISGMSKDGTRFFYVNPLEVNPEACRKDQRKKHVDTERQKWFGCACCPPNLARLLASVASYACSVGDHTLAFHLYVGGEVSVPFSGMKICVESGLPWDGRVSIRIREQEKERVPLTMILRIPGWSRTYKVSVNGKEICQEPRKGYLYIQREWEKNDCLDLEFPMKAERNYSNPMVKYNFGKTAVSRGPIVYCMEETDNGSGLMRFLLPKENEFSVCKGNLEEGETDLEVSGFQVSVKGWDDRLYSFQREDEKEDKILHFVPYYLWNNRGVGEMNVWVTEDK